MMTRKAIIVMCSTVSALLAMGTGVNSYQETQRERREALEATVVAMQFLDGALDRVKSSLEQSTTLREDLIRQTDNLLASTVTSEEELINHGTQVSELSRKRNTLSQEAVRILSEVRSSMADASKAAGNCQRIVGEEKLKATQSALVEAQLREKMVRIKEVNSAVERFESLVNRCDVLASGLQAYAEENRAALSRMEVIRKEAESAKIVQRARQTSAQEVNDRLSKLQAELQRDLDSLRPTE